MLKEINFENFRNLNGSYNFSSNFNVFFGKNNAGKTNLLDGIKLAFSLLNPDCYYKVSVYDFKNCNDDNPIKIKLVFDSNDIPSLDIVSEDGSVICGCIITVYKTSSGYYRKNITYLNLKPFDVSILHDDPNMPFLVSLPVLRIEDIYSDNLSAELDKFIQSQKYEEIISQVKDEIRTNMEAKVKTFKDFCKDFDENIDIEFNNPTMVKEKVSVVDGGEKQNIKIGSGYKSLANVFLNLLEGKKCILTIDEIENHLHPSMIRKLIKKLSSITNIFVVCTTHSPVVVNEVDIKSLFSFPNKRLGSLSDATVSKLNKFLTTGRCELLFCEKFVLVEGYTEKLLFESYCKDNQLNWTIINVAGVMFEPYIELANYLDKQGVIISDNDISLSDKKEKSERFNSLVSNCSRFGFTLVEMNNTLETDLYESGFLNDYKSYLTASSKHEDIVVAKQGQKTALISKLIENGFNIEEWHIIKEIKNVI